MPVTVTRTNLRNLSPADLSEDSTRDKAHELMAPLFGNKTHDFASTADGANASTTVTVTGAAVGDFAMASLGVTLAAGVVLGAYVSAADTVTVFVQNESGAAFDPASTDLAVIVFKKA